MEKLTTYEKIYGEKYEKQISESFVLPEYLPSISKILRVTASVNTPNCEYSSVISVEGRINFCVLYESEFDGSLKSVAFSCDLNHSFSKAPPQEPDTVYFSECKANVISESAKPIDSRKISISCTVALEAILSALKLCYPFEALQSETLKIKSVPVSCMKIVPLSGLDIQVSENVSIPEGMPGVREVVFCDGEMILKDISYAEKNVRAEGNLRYTCMYLTDEDKDGNGYAVFSGSLPCSASAELDIELKDADVLCRTELIKIACEPTVNSYGDSNGCKIEAFGKITGKVFGNSELSVIEDIFCTKNDCTAEIKELPEDTFDRVVKSCKHIEESIRTELGNMTEIVSCGINVQDVRAEMSSGVLECVCSAVVKILGSNPNGGLESKSAKLTYRHPLGDTPSDFPERYRTENVAEAMIDSARIENGEIRLAFTSNACVAVCAEKRVRAVTALEIDDSAEYVRDKSKYVIYYPTKSDSVWSVAKRYKTDPVQISELNGLSKDGRIDKPCVVIPR